MSSSRSPSRSRTETRDETRARSRGRSRTRTTKYRRRSSSSRSSSGDRQSRPRAAKSGPTRSRSPVNASSNKSVDHRAPRPKESEQVPDRSSVHSPRSQPKSRLEANASSSSHQQDQVTHAFGAYHDGSGPDQNPRNRWAWQPGYVNQLDWQNRFGHNQNVFADPNVCRPPISFPMAQASWHLPPPPPPSCPPPEDRVIPAALGAPPAEEDEHRALTIDSDGKTDEGAFQAALEAAEGKQKSYKLLCSLLLLDSVDLEQKFKIIDKLPNSWLVSAYMYDNLDEEVKDRISSKLSEEVKDIDLEEGQDKAFDPEDATYRQKCDAAFQVIGKTMKSDKVNESDITDYKKGFTQRKVYFPMSNTVDKHFIRYWNSLRGSDIEAKITEGITSLTPFQMASKEGKQFAFKKYPPMKFYNMEKEECKWPMGKVTVDSDFNPLISKVSAKETPNFDTWMKKTGDILRIVNQQAFFAEAMKKLLDELVQFGLECDDPNLGARLKLIADFNNVRGKSLEDLANISTGLQLSLLLAKREEALEKAAHLKDKEVDSSVLRFASPLDSEQRLFSGVLSEYNTLRASRVERQQLISLSLQASQLNKGTKRPAPGGNNNQGNQGGNKKAKSTFSSNYNITVGGQGQDHSFRGQKNVNKTQGSAGAGAGRNFIKTNQSQIRTGNTSVSFHFFLYYIMSRIIISNHD